MAEFVTLLIDWILFRDIKFVTLLMCSKHKEIHDFQNAFNEASLRYSCNQSIANLGGFHVTVADLECEHFVHYMKKKELNAGNKWFLIANVGGWETSLESIEFRMDSDVKVLETSTNSIYDIHGFGDRTKIVHLGKVDDLQRRSTYELRKELSGLTLNVAAVLDKSNSALTHDYLVDTKFKHLQPQDKLNFGLFLVLQEVHKFKSNLVTFIKDNKIYPTGVDEEVARNMDVVTTSCLMNEEAIRSFDLMIPNYLLKTALIFRNPGNFEGKNDYLDTMSSEVWYLTFASTLLVVLLLRVVYTFDVKFNENAEEIVKINCKEGKTWSAVVSDTLSILIQQGSNYEPTCISGKIVLFSYLFLAVLLYNYYTAVMVSDLLSHPPPPFSSVEQMAKAGVQFGYENNTLIKTFFNESSFFKEEYDLAQGTSRIKEGMFALHAQTDTVYSLVEQNLDLKEICDLAELDLVEPQEMYVFLKKNSQYKEIFTITYRKMIESGIFQYISGKWLTAKPACLANRDMLVVGTDKCKPIYVTFALGCLLAALALSCEIFKMKRFAKPTMQEAPRENQVSSRNEEALLIP